MGVEISGGDTGIEGQDEILTPEALDFVATLQRTFGARRDELLAARATRQAEVERTHRLDFLPETRDVRTGDWSVAAAPEDLLDRRCEMTGPTDRKMTINALNSGARVWLADMEDASTPHWGNVVGGQVNLRDAIRRSISFTNPKGKEYSLRTDQGLATIVMRPRGWHMDDKNLLIDDAPSVGALVDFGLYFFHNAAELLERGSGPYFYLPKMESHLEARLWNDVFVHAQDALGIPQGSIRATVLIETIPHESGVFGFKCFLLHSGVDEFPHLDGEQLLEAMREIASFAGLLNVHAEDEQIIESAPQSQFPSTHYEDFLASRPRDAENLAIAHVIAGAIETGCRVHILHVSSAEALPQIQAAKADGVQITAETCPHYLTLRAEDIPDGATQFKCCPPIREGANQDELWAGLADGTLDMIVSDHSPSTIDLKHLESGDFGVAWGGVASVQVSLAAIWTAARERGFSLGQVSHWMSQAPAAQAGLPHKGNLVVGADADLIAFAADESFVVNASDLQHKNAITAYAGKELTGVVRQTWVRGRRVDIHGDPHGELLTRPTA